MSVPGVGKFVSVTVVVCLLYDLGKSKTPTCNLLPESCGLPLYKRNAQATVKKCGMFGELRGLTAQPPTTEAARPDCPAVY